MRPRDPASLRLLSLERLVERLERNVQSLEKAQHMTADEIASIKSEAHIQGEVARRLSERADKTREQLSMSWVKFGILSLLFSGMATIVTVLHQAGIL